MAERESEIQLAIRKFFEKRYPGAVGSPSFFWSRVLDNTISTQELRVAIEMHEKSGNTGAVYHASVDLLDLRESGLVTAPLSENIQNYSVW